MDLATEVAYEEVAAFGMAASEAASSEVTSGKEAAVVADPESQPGQGLLLIALKKAC